MTPQARRICELKQLLRLRELRQEGARLEREARRAACEAARALLREHEVRLDELRRQRAALVAWVAGEGAAAMARLQGFADARRRLLDEDCERAEYDLIDDREAIARADQALERAQADWMRACSRTQSVERLLARTRTGLAKQAERRAEREVEPVSRGVADLAGAAR